jgi:hypothetical protein
MALASPFSFSSSPVFEVETGLIELPFVQCSRSFRAGARLWTFQCQLPAHDKALIDRPRCGVFEQAFVFEAVPNR